MSLNLLNYLPPLAMIPAGRSDMFFTLLKKEALTGCRSCCCSSQLAVSCAPRSHLDGIAASSQRRHSILSDRLS